MRLEYKFLVPNNCMDALRNRLKPYVMHDKFSRAQENKEYTVRSIYFDTLGLTHYHDKIEGIRTRKKVRIRAYNGKSDRRLVFLEIKRKYENYIYKNRSKFPYDDLPEIVERLDLDNFDKDALMNEKDWQNARQFLYQLLRYNLQPTVLTVYEREAFYAKSNSNLRITLDKNLRSLQFPRITQIDEENQLVHVMPHHFIMEVKFYGGFALWLQSILETFGLSRRALSKYTISLYQKYQRNPFFGRTDFAYLNRQGIAR